MAWTCVSPGRVGILPTRGSTIANWQVAEADLVIIGFLGQARKIELLLIDISNLVGNITIRLYANVNGVERRFYPIPAAITFSVAGDAPAIPVINGTIGIYGQLRATIQSDNAADNGMAVSYEAN